MYHQCEVRSTDYFGGGRGVFASSDIAKGTLVHVCSRPHVSVVFSAWKKEICAACLAYGAWKLKALDIDDRFCTEKCREGMDLHLLEKKVALAMAGRKENERRRKATRKASMKASTSLPNLNVDADFVEATWIAHLPPLSPQLPSTSSKFWTSINFDEPLNELELDTARFVLDGLARRFYGPADEMAAWNEVLDLQSTELDHILQHGTGVLESHLRIFSYVRAVSASLRISEVDIRETTRGLLARDHGNAFGLFSTSPDESDMIGFGLYTTASYFNHHCLPNVKKEAAVGLGFGFRTIRDVKEGEELCIAYIDENLPLNERQKQLKYGWLFDCQCVKCLEDLL